MTAAPPATRPSPDRPAAPDDLAPWERDALRKLRLLRQGGKRAILYITEDGTIFVFRAEVAGRIAP